MRSRKKTETVLAAGEKHAQTYFVSRVDMMLARMTPKDGSAPLYPGLDLANFMLKYWPDFKKGLKFDT